MKKRILIVDDDVPLTQMVKFNLEGTGQYEVKVENYSPCALEAARSFQPDLILLDYIMPLVDGGDISKRLRTDPELQQVPVIMVTALVSNRDMREDGTAERNGHLMVAKPIRFEKLRQCIEQQLTTVI